MDAIVESIGTHVTVVGELPAGTSVAFVDHGFGVVAAFTADDSGGRALVLPVRVAAPEVGDLVRVEATSERARGAVLRARGGAAFGDVGTIEGVSLDVWHRVDRLTVRASGAWLPAAGAADVLVGWDRGGWAVGAQAGAVRWEKEAPGASAGLWARAGTMDGLHVAIEGLLLPGGGVTGRVSGQVPAGNLMDALGAFTTPISGSKPMHRQGVGVGVWVRRWGGPGSIRGELWALDVSDELPVYEDGPGGWRPEFRAGVRW